MYKNFDYEKFLGEWSQLFPDKSLTLADFKKPHSIMKALLVSLNRLGVDQDAVLSPPPEQDRDIHTCYYLDLIPVINVTRVINYLLYYKTEQNILNININIRQIIQPSPNTSCYILYFLFNYIVFHEARLKDIEPYDADFFGKRDKVKALEDKKNELLEALNQQAKEKGERSEKLNEIEQTTQLCEEEFKHDKQFHDAEKVELEELQKEYQYMELVHKQKKDHRNAEQAELARNKSLRVYDSEDIRAQLMKATQNVQEADEKLKSLQETLKKKENILENLQAIQPSLVTCNNYLNELKNVMEENIDDCEIEADMNDGQLELINSELEELEEQLLELQEARARIQDQRAETNRQLEKAQLMSTLKETEDLERKSYEKSQKSLKAIQEMKVMSPKYIEMNNQYKEEINQIVQQFTTELSTFQKLFTNKLQEYKRRSEDKLRELKNRD